MGLTIIDFTIDSLVVWQTARQRRYLEPPEFGAAGHHCEHDEVDS
jgi:hypothetical protein